MEDLFKKVLYTGVGLVATGAEKLQETIDQLVSENKISVDEGKKIVDDFFSNTEAKRNEFEAKIKEVTENVMDRFNFVTSEDITKINERLDALEAKVGVAETAPKAAPKATAKKATAKKTTTSKKTAAKKDEAAS